MKFIHLSDLHLGKRLNEFSLIEDQKYILTQILSLIQQLRPDGVIIAGDVYDKSIPSVEAVTLFDEFLFSLSNLNLPTFIIGGNHDSQERLSFGGRLLLNNKIYISPLYNGKIEKVTLNDQYGPLNVYLLPFVKPSHVKRFFPEEKIDSYTQALQKAIAETPINPLERNLIITHQFITGATTCESEELSVGGTDNVDISIFKDFDYVALGHIHSPQQLAPNVRYCGTPLKYSFSEAKHLKSLTIVEFKQKGETTISTHPLTPLHDLREIRGSYEYITKKSNYENTNQADYVKITLTDETPIVDAISKLRVIYPNLMKLEYDNTQTRKNQNLESVINVENKSPLQLFEEFYILQNNQGLSLEQEHYIKSLIEEIWEDKR